MTVTFPPVFDADFYASEHVELCDLTAVQLRHHWLTEGRERGLIASSAARREWYPERLRGELDILEIGPFDSPVLRGPRVKYFDVLDQNQLRARADQVGRSGVVPYIDYVDADGNLSVVPRSSADVVLSSHSIEHSPDLVSHLNQAGDILSDGGTYIAIVPDKRFCFDHFVPLSTLGQVLQAHFEGRNRHTLNSLVEHRAMTTHNDAVRHWNGDHGTLGMTKERVEAALQQFESANGGYIDVHAWQFTPVSFRRIVQMLFELKLSKLEPIRVYHTFRPRLEFVAVMRKA